MDYKNGKIYQILNSVNDEVYVGSTTQPLCKRLYKHKRNSIERVECKSPLYELMRDIGNDNFYIELIELYPCNSKEELNSREGQYIRDIGTLNKVINGRTYKEYVEENIEHIKQYQQTYRENNKEYMKQYKQKYQQDNKERLKAQKQQYYENNPEKKEQLKTMLKQHYETHKEENAEKRKLTIVCECGRELRKADLNRHLKTNIHKQLMEQQI